MILTVLLLVSLVITVGATVYVHRMMKEVELELKKAKARARSLQRELDYYKPQMKWER